jgi:transposase
MTTTAVTTVAAPILAIDLGKYKCVACIYRSAHAQRFQSIATRRQQLAELIDRHRPAVVLIEACLLAGWVHDLCVAQGVPCLVANTTTEAWRFKHLKRKTDRDDALRLAEVYQLGQFPSVAIPAKQVREKRALIETRQKLVGRRVALQNCIRAVLVGQGLPAPVGARAWSRIGLAGIATHARPLAECGPLELWHGRLHLALTELEQVQGLLELAERKLDELAKTDAGMQILDTIPGVGPRTAEAVVAFLPEGRPVINKGRAASATASPGVREAISLFWTYAGATGRVGDRAIDVARKLTADHVLDRPCRHSSSGARRHISPTKTLRS